ncbi:MAG: TIGR02281 family clan AA aspartic protease [Rhodobacteraceae bacterium]|nr:TIGR02281 family clan AA aspartic protease [Paracoccaceae bacterium]
MSADQVASFVYLAILGTVIASYFFVANAHQLGRLAQQAMIWVLIIVGLAAAAGLWSDIRDTAANRQSVIGDGHRIEVTLARDGHYHLTLGINGTPVQFLVDTGASDLVLSREDAARAGIDTASLRFTGSAVTANGMVQTATVYLDSVQLGGKVDHNVPAEVGGGTMPGSLLGMSYLSRFASISIEGNRMTLTR